MKLINLIFYKKVKVFNKGWYQVDLVLTYEIPIIHLGSEWFMPMELKGTAALNEEWVFTIPETIVLDGPKGVYLKANAVLGVDIFNERILNNPQCYHVWGVTLITAYSSMPCWDKL